MNNLELAVHFFKDPKGIASVCSSSSFAVKRILKKIDFSKRIVIAEYGPGTGAFTYPLLKRMNKNSKLILLEKNKGICRKLREEVDDKRMRLANTSAENIEAVLKKSGAKQADYILSGIPFSYLTDWLRDDILESTYNALKDDGKFIVYQFMPFVKKHLDRYFKIKRIEFELRNFPPLIIYEAVRH